jgi:hypothetical protein
MALYICGLRDVRVTLRAVSCQPLALAIPNPAVGAPTLNPGLGLSPLSATSVSSGFGLPAVGAPAFGPTALRPCLGRRRGL